MRRVAIFADAGYLHTGGAIALTGSSQPRQSMELVRSKVIAKLEATANEKANGAPLLRIYWYDGLLHGRPSAEQESLASMDNVKVRLGTVTAGQQKGVDSLIVTDLIELARNHAISDAILLSGDEDIRIGVQIAQSFGVRVHLVGIEPSGSNQSRLLRQEADTTKEWSKEDIQEILSLRPIPQTTVNASQPQTGSEGSKEVTSEILNQVASVVVVSLSEYELRTVDEAMAQGSRLIPPDYDRLLLAESRQRIGRDLEQSEKLHIREKFKELVNDHP